MYAVGAQVCLNILRAGLIASRIDLSTQLYPGVIAAPLIIGSIAGSGGRFSIDPILGSFGVLEGASSLRDLLTSARVAPSQRARHLRNRVEHVFLQSAWRYVDGKLNCEPY